MFRGGLVEVLEVISEAIFGRQLEVTFGAFPWFATFMNMVDV